MNLTYVPLLYIQRELQGLPRNYERFQQYLRTIIKADGSDVELVPMLAMNPMGKDHVTARLDELLGFKADEIGAQAAAEAVAATADVPGGFKAALVVVDDAGGGWTNRWSYEFNLRVPSPGHKRFWVTEYLWSSEEHTPHSVRRTMLRAVYRTAYAIVHGTPGNLRQLMKQEGAAMSRAGCTAPTLDQEDLEYTRQVIEPHLDASDMPTCIACLFGDDAGKTLGFTPRGLSPWAGVALALHDAGRN